MPEMFDPHPTKPNLFWCSNCNKYHEADSSEVPQSLEALGVSKATIEKLQTVAVDAIAKGIVEAVSDTPLGILDFSPEDLDLLLGPDASQEIHLAMLPIPPSKTFGLMALERLESDIKRLQRSAKLLKIKVDTMPDDTN